MDLHAECPLGCPHFLWEHDLGGDARGCRYCRCQMGKSAWPLPSRHAGMFTPKPDWLKGSALYGSGLGYAGVAGEGSTGLFIMAESLGEEEERASKPLVGKTGQFTARMIARITDPETGKPLDMERDFVRGNIVPIKPPFNKLDMIPWMEQNELLHLAKPVWEAELAKAKPKAIFAMGDWALRSLTGVSGITKVRGAVIETEYGLVVGSFHPAYLLRGKLHLSKVWQTDLKRALYLARHGKPAFKTYYILNPTGLDAQKFHENWVLAGRPPLATDIETVHPKGFDKDEEPLGGEEGEEADLAPSEDPSYRILQISFSYKGGEAITMPWLEPYISWALKLLAEATTLYTWNGESFDLPRLVAAGAVIKADHIDVMNLWHLLEPALPMGLKPTSTLFFFDIPAAWASRALASEEPELYSCLDSCTLVRLGKMLWSRAVKEGKWELFQRQFVLLGKVLRAMSNRGVKTDPVVRKAAREKFEEKFEESVKGLQEKIPLDILPRKTYKVSEERLRKSGKWVEGRMVEVTVMEKPPKPTKKTFVVTYLKALKKGPKEKTKRVRAFTVEEAMGMVDGALSAIEEGEKI